MPEEAELHPIRRGSRGNRRLLPERLVRYKVPARLAFRTAAQLPFGPHLEAIRTVRAACLRSAIALVVAILDSKGSDRTSLGQIIKLLADTALEEFFLEKRGQSGRDASIREKLAELRDRYAKVIDSDSFKCVAQLRHDEIGHLLIRDEDTPASEHIDVFWLADEAERLVVILHAGLGMLQPQFVEIRHKTDANARMFWDTFLTRFLPIAPGNHPRAG